MSDRVCIQSNGTRKAIISDGDLLACCRSRCGFGCVGGWPIRAFNYFSLVGICTGGRYREKNVCKPYPIYPCGHHQNQTYYGPCSEKISDTPVCRRVCRRTYPIPYQKDKIYGNSTYIIPNNETIIMTEIMTRGPVVATYKIYEDFAYYKGGIYVHTAGEQKGAHAVRVIGWGEENLVPYWLVANSWNTDWGEKGYFRILRGKNHCDIENQMLAGMVNV
ncbi:papain family cysteine protease [Ancylostoma caninum]|uniref:Papain family cysteine protease n=1 Tax=Ancylostoma caninum TaxID=29170 RepID=A0A368H955_ANCCA|nr:papain family cysteine protease [Ancylostoma caninum]